LISADTHQNNRIGSTSGFGDGLSRELKPNRGSATSQHFTHWKSSHAISLRNCNELLNIGRPIDSMALVVHRSPSLSFFRFSLFRHADRKKTCRRSMVFPCFVAKQYILQQKCSKKLTGSFLLETRRYNF